MATKKEGIKVLKKNREALKETVANIHDQVLVTAEDLIETSVESGIKYQKLAAKAIKKSQPIFDKQVDMLYDTLEEMQSQYHTGTKRFKKLIGYDKTAKKVMKQFKETSKQVSSVSKQVTSVIEPQIETVSKLVKKVTGQAEKTTRNFVKSVAPAAAEVKKTVVSKKPAVKKTVKSVTKKIKSVKVAPKKVTAKKVATAKKATAKTVATVKATAKKATAKKVTAKKVTAKKATARKATSTKVTAKKVELTAINGIGPKVASLMNAQGINSISDLSRASKTRLETIKEAAGPRFSKFNVNDWVKAAKAL